MAEMTPVAGTAGVGPETPRMRALRQLSSQLPVANQQVAAGQQAARDIQLQQAVKQSRPGQAVASTAQQLGSAMQAQAGQQMVETAKQNLQNQGQLAQSAVAEQKQQAGAEVSSAGQGLEQQKQDQLSRFANLSASAKQEMFDSRVQFQRDQNGKTLLNERQLADYAKMKAQSDQDFQNYAQKSDQLSRRKLATMQAVQAQLEQGLKQDQAEYQQLQDAISKGGMTANQMVAAKQIAAEKAAKLEELQRTQNDYLANIQNETSSAQARMQQNTAIGGMLGTAAGYVGAVWTGNPEAAPAAGAGGGAAGAAGAGWATEKGLM